VLAGPDGHVWVGSLPDPLPGVGTAHPPRGGTMHGLLVSIALDIKVILVSGPPCISHQ
jgi:hypothetical protein